jgi:pteridine reductase
MSSVSPNPASPHIVRRTALITGASHRVGRAISLELARAGFDLVLTYRSRAQECGETARLAKEAAQQAGFAISASTHALDLSDTKAAEEFARSRAAACGMGEGGGGGTATAIDVLVHNASEYRANTFGATSAQDLEVAHRVEVVSPFLMTQGLREPLSRSTLSGGASVIFFSDTYALGRARAGFTPYMIAKAAVETLARQLAVELAPKVRVHCIAPGVILWPDDFPSAAKDAILARTPLARTGTAEDAARLVRFLALEASFATGETIRIDGGRALR